MTTSVTRTIILLLALALVAHLYLAIFDNNSPSITSAHAQDRPESVGERYVLWVDIDDIISTGTAEHVTSAVERASDGINGEKFSAIVLALDTPGGALDATLDIIASIQESKVPVIGYVYPQGRSAWSAGTVILVSTDYAAMAPFTTIGSAQPVRGDMPVNDTKVINAVTEKMVSLAELHNRNATQATRFITHNDNLTPEKAQANNIIEAIASDPAALLQQADNVTVTTLKGPRVLETLGANIIVHEPSLRVTLVNILANPVLSTTLLTIGFFALIYGLTSPGFGAEIAGGAMIILALVGQGFDVNWAAFALLAIGVGLVAYELYSPGFGAIGIGGIVVLVAGSTLMITQPVRPTLVNEEYVGNLALLSAALVAPFAGFFGFITYKAWKAKKAKPQQFAYQNEVGTALDPISETMLGFVLVGGEYWRAKTLGAVVNKGDKLRIVGKEADILVVEPLSAPA